MELKLKTASLDDTKKLAEAFSNSIPENGIFVTLTGDIGAGKTQFIRFVLEFLDVKEHVTSPSFVILNEYKSEKFSIYHFDLYRLEEKGLKSIIAELREYSKNGYLTFVEWAEFGLNEIPPGALKINVEYDEKNLDIRWFSFSSDSDFNKNFLENFKKEVEL